MSEKKSDGGPAFPSAFTYSDRDGDITTKITDGMTLRDYFAAQALSGLIQYVGYESIANVVEHSYKIADAMIAEREK